MLIISYYTLDYTEAAKNLKKSLEKFDIAYEIIPILDKGSWVENCAMKPFIIYDALIRNKKPIVFIDADAVVHEYPALFDHIKSDIAFHSLDREKVYGQHKKGKEVLSGTIFVNYTKRAVTLIKQWCDEQYKHKDEYDQRVLANVLRRSDASVYDLPPSYTLIYDTMKCYGKPVIEHFQHSRKNRKR